MDPMNPIPGEPTVPPIEPAPSERITGYCRTCGKPLTESTTRVALGTVFCEDHAPNVNAPPPVEPPSPYQAPPRAPSVTNATPGLAFLLGLLPGVGAIYNGQYAKGFIHVVVFGLLISILGSDSSSGMEAFFGLLLSAFVFYQAFEAYHTARKRQLGEPVDEFSGLATLSADGNSGFFTGPIILITVGVFFLLSNFGLLHLRQLLRFWPVLLIVLGIGMLSSRMKALRSSGSSPREGVPYEQR
jgi:hypothetical protein